MALVAGLVHPARLGPAHRFAENGIGFEGVGQTEDEDVGRIRIGDDSGVGWVLVAEAGEGVELRVLVDGEVILGDGGFELKRLEEVFAGTGKNRHSIGGGLQFRF